MCFCVFLYSCAESKKVSTEEYRKEVERFCAIFSDDYWQKNGLAKTLYSAEPSEKQNMYMKAFRSEITSQEMMKIIFERPKDIKVDEYYFYLKKHIPNLTDKPFSCVSMEQIYLKPVDSSPVLQDEKGVSKFSSVIAMLESFRDYVSEYGTLKVLSEEPLHIQLSPRLIAGEESKVIGRMVDDAIIYGIYRSYVHTSIDSITVTVIPLELDMETRESLYLKNYIKTLSISREEAFSLIKKYLDIELFSDLILKKGGLPNQWSFDFDSLINDSNNPKMKKLMMDLERIGSK